MGQCSRYGKDECAGGSRGCCKWDGLERRTEREEKKKGEIKGGGGFCYCLLVLTVWGFIYAPCNAIVTADHAI